MQQNINPDQIQTGVVSGQIPLIGVGNKLDTSVIPSNITVDTSTNSTNSTNSINLDGNPSTFYRNAGNLNAGTIPAARLSGTYGISITGIASSAGSAVTAGNADNADLLGNQNSAFYRDASNLNAGIIPGARLIGTYPISISGTAAVATTASDSALLGTFNSAFYRNAGNLNAGTIPSARLSGTYPISISGLANNANLAFNSTDLGGFAANLYARLSSPTFVGSPSAPTQTVGSNSTALATTEFVTAAVSSATFNILTGKTWKVTTSGIPNLVTTLITVNSSILDEASLWGGALNPSRFVATAGISKIKLIGLITFVGLTGLAGALLIRNGSFSAANILAVNSAAATPSGGGNLEVVSNWINTTPGDYFELYFSVNQSGGGATVQGATEKNTWLQYSAL